MKAASQSAKANSKLWKAPWKVTSGGKGSGIRFDMHLYVYADGHGNLHAGDANHPVDSSEQAIEVFAKTWKMLRLAAARNAKKTTVKEAAP